MDDVSIAVSWEQPRRPQRHIIHISAQKVDLHRSVGPPNEALLILLPLLVIISILLFVLLIFLVCVLLLRRRRGIALRDSGGPLDLSRDDFVEADGGLEGVENRWLENVSSEAQNAYQRAKGLCPIMLPFVHLG
jgi:hypothetical protein